MADSGSTRQGTPRKLLEVHSHNSSTGSEDDVTMKIVLVGEDTHNLEDVARKIKGVSEIYKSETGLEFVKDACECELSFVLGNFEGELFTKLHRAQVRIIGPPIIHRCVRDSLPLPLNVRPLFTWSMQDLVVCFTGFKNKAKLIWLVDHVHYMGGSVRKDESIKITHMVANITHGRKYRYAVNMGKPIMSEDWINRLWSDRIDIDSTADHPKMIAYRMKPFYECCLSFLGFSAEEQRHMEELTIENGGTFAEPGNEDTTHLVIDDQNIKEVPQDITVTAKVFLVRGEWFWGCIQMAACADEQIYTFEKMSTPARYQRNNNAMAKNRKRKRLQELVAETEGSPFMAYKRRSSSTDISATSMSPDSFLDLTYTPDKSDTLLAELKLENKEDGGKYSKRRMVVMELLQTEQNYVGILQTILNTFKAQIEKPDQYNGPILAQQDTKIIFGNIPPIYEAHCKLRDSLLYLVEHWSENNSIGDCLLKRADELMKAYPPFVNFFENTKETIQKCDHSNPRFHAFLKLCLSKPECGRQSLQELLIRPVQRLPSIVLLLQDLLKRTDASNPDKVKLEQAIEKVKNIMTHINEDKRKTESQVVMFDIVNDIDNCPATLLSANRHFVMKVDVMELSGNLSSRGDPLTLFVFSDNVEICKRRMKILGSTSRSPAIQNHKTPQKAYKHLEMISMTSIKRVLDVDETEDCRLAFGLICKDSAQTKEKLYSFTLAMDDISKNEVLTCICKNLAIVLCRPDIETFLAKVNGEELNINTKDLHKGNKALKFSRRVSRAFSFNKTPSKLKRAVSGMVHGLSPFVRDSKQFNGTGVRKLASTFDLTERLDDDSDTMSLGAYSLQEEGISPSTSIIGSPQRLSKPSHIFVTPSKSAAKAVKTPKWATIGPSSASKTKYL
ncbi:protein ECT2-like isoform X1 [Biomphalaria glabrata]|uniref:Protein ECT2-like isoform X1 n=1 Tax=Biomphalaria glabrata TaxID=6526 RepID=A0A9U8DZI2_BIOGL|nr:protein ECT2-like isoform X1 [Biomphalaria glabrata]KAI8751286.1 protein ECT2-like isoform X1 [Biomphalaria glabrata]KAI8772584.1 protein ECT2 isoform X1 [Biomphalaria glabrata]